MKKIAFFLCIWNRSFNFVTIMDSRKEKFIEKAKLVHKNKYDYKDVVYIDSKTPIAIICPKHGVFYQRPNHHLEGHGCQLCSGKMRGTTEDFIAKAHKVHGDKYIYTDVVYKNSHTKVTIICPQHGPFPQTPTNHLSGFGCPCCKAEKNKKLFSFTTEQFIERANELYNGKYIYTDINYVNSQTPINIICPKHGVFSQLPNNHLQGKGCPICGNQLSKAEDEIAKFIKEHNIKVITRNKDILDGLEVDIYIPSLRIGIEYDGLIWHSEKCKVDKNYHLKKTETCEKKGIRLIHIFEDEWVNHKDIVLSRLKNILSINDGEKIYARKCVIKQIEQKESKNFINANHLQGHCEAKVHYGLYHKGELVSVMSFGLPRQKKKYGGEKENSWEIIRFCNKINTSVVGGASKLLQHFIAEMKPKSITTYADRRWSNGNLYKTLGFTHTHNSTPNYSYVVNKQREGRFKYRKSELVRQGFDPNKTEHEIMLERGIYRIFDCGNMVFNMTFGNK